MVTADAALTAPLSANPRAGRQPQLRRVDAGASHRRRMDPWVAKHAAAIASRTPGELTGLVAISSPSGDRSGAERMRAALRRLAPAGADIQTLVSSTPGWPGDLLITLPGTGTKRLLLLGHADTVIAHAEHRPLTAAGSRLDGSGSFDMKGGLVFALGVMRALAERREQFAQIALLVTSDEEVRVSPLIHVDAFAGWDACLTFEGGEHAPDGSDAVIVARKGAFTLRLAARGRSAHSGASPSEGANALTALAGVVGGLEIADETQPVSVVPVRLRSGEPINQVPADAELLCDVRAFTHADARRALAAVPDRVGDVRLSAELACRFPPMPESSAARDLLTGAASLLARPVTPARRGGSSDACHFAAHVDVCVDGLGPCGGGDHGPDEHVDASTLTARAQVALAITLAALSIA